MAEITVSEQTAAWLEKEAARRGVDVDGVIATMLSVRDVPEVLPGERDDG